MCSCETVELELLLNSPTTDDNFFLTESNTVSYSAPLQTRRFLR